MPPLLIHATIYWPERLDVIPDQAALGALYVFQMDPELLLTQMVPSFTHAATYLPEESHTMPDHIDCEGTPMIPGMVVGGSVVPGRGSVVPGRGSVVPGRGSVVPGRGSVVPGRGSVVPGVGERVVSDPLTSKKSGLPIAKKV